MNIKKLKLSEVRRIKADPVAPYIVYCENKKSSHLLIYFGSYGGNYAGMSNVESLQCNAIFIRSDKANWYLQNYGEGVETPELFAKFINKFVAKLSHIKTVCVAGFSMGGFGALLFGTWLNCDRIVATAPQTMFPDFHIIDGIPKFPHNFGQEYKSIKRLWMTHGKPNCEIILQGCDKILEMEGFRDVEEIFDLRSQFDDIQVVLYNCSGHKEISAALLSNKQEYEKLFVI